MGGSIRLFEFAQKFHKIIGIYPTQANQPQHSINSTQKLFLAGSAQSMVTTAAFLVFEATTIFNYGYAFYILISIMNSAAIYIIFIWQLSNTLEFIENCEKFIEKRVQSTIGYQELAGKIELFNKFLCFAICITLAILYFTVLPYTFVRYYIFNMGKDSFELFYPPCYPFDWRTPFGYLVAWLAQCAGAPSVGSIYIQFSNLLIGSCWLFIFIAEDITQDLAEFNIIAKTATDENRAELTKRFCDILQIYWDAKQCVKDFNQIIKYSLFAYFSWTMLGVSSMLVTLQFQLWADESNTFEIISSCYVLIWMIVFTLLLCEPGARMTNQFVAFSEKLIQCDWYLLSIGMQRMYLIFLSDTRNPIKMLSYANISCERDTSRKMIYTAFSYFMTIRRFRA